MSFCDLVLEKCYQFSLTQEGVTKTFDEVYLVNYSSYDDVNLYEVGCQKCDPSYGYGPIIRKLYILHYVVSGEGILRINNHEFAIKEHDIFVIPAHTASYYEADENHPWNYIWIQFDGFKIKEMLNNCGLSDKSPILSLHQEAKKAEDCIRHILTNYGDEYACIGKVYELFQHMIHAANLKETSIFSLAEKLNVDPLALTEFYMQEREESHA